MTLPVVFTANGPSGYNLTNSLRFRSSASAYLNRTFGTPTDPLKWTWSSWVKRSNLGSNGTLIAGVTSGSIYSELRFVSTDILRFHQENGATTVSQIDTVAVFRDPSAWYHVVCVYDSANATTANRLLIYINGVLQTTTAVVAVPSSQASNINKASEPSQIGNLTVGPFPFDGYLTEVNFIDGQALTPSSFGQTSSTTGVWIPKKYTGTYGTNGFYLPFTDNSALTTSSNVGLGKDFSGNANYWTTNNISITSGSTYDSMTDVPTLTSATAANYPVLSPIDNTGVTISNANLTATTPSSNQACKATMSLPTTGKFYFEVTDVVTGGGNIVGIANVTLPTNTSLYLGTGSIYVTMSSNAVFGLAFNFDALTYTIYKNNSVDSTGSITSGITYIPFMQTSASGGASTAFNFGQRPFTYTPPTGFNRLNTFNLPTPTIGATASTTANKYFDATTFDGVTGGGTVTNSGSMQPDFVWMKVRNNANNHELADSVRGTPYASFSNLTNAEVSDTRVSAFNSNGFSYGTNSNSAITGRTVVGWQWRASNAAGVSNTAGSITSTVSANTTAGFSIVTYTGTGSNATVGHGLGIAPSMAIIKMRSAVQNWTVYHASLGNTTALSLDLTDAASTTALFWNNTSPTSSLITLGSGNGVNKNTETYVAYCFAQVAGYSAFGSYVGNGVADGPFIYTGFRPRYFILKNITSAQSWSVQDTSRSPYNVASAVLLPNSSSAELTGTDFIDIVSNGFKIRHSSSGNNNNSGDTYIYMAFCESPFKFSNAR